MLASLYLIGIVLTIMGLLLYITGVRFLNSARKIKRNTLESIKILDKRVKNKYNRIALLPVNELDEYLIQAFAACLEMASAEFVSEKDHNAAVALYAKSLEYLMVYLGEDTIDALEYFYGKGFLTRWCELYYNLLNTKKCISKIVNKMMSAEAIRSVLMMNKAAIIKHNESGGV